MQINVGDLMSLGLDAQKAFELAFQACTAHPVIHPALSLLSASGVVYVPAGVYELSKTLVIPRHVQLQGEGMTSVLAFSSGGLETPRFIADPDPKGNITSALFYLGSRISDISVVNTDSANTHAGLLMVGGAGVQIERVSSAGWQNHYLLDQAALVSFEQCYLGGIIVEGKATDSENGIVIVDPPAPPITKGGSANVNTVSRCFFSVGGHPVVFKGDVMLTVDRCYVNSGASIIIGGRRASVLNCQFEAIKDTECILVDSPGETGAISLDISGCSFAGDISAVRLNTKAIVGFMFNGNYAYTNHVRDVDKNIVEYRHVIENPVEFPFNQIQGPAIMLGSRNWGDSPMVANDALSGDVVLYASSADAGDSSNSRDRVGIGTLKPQALLELFGPDSSTEPSPADALLVRTEQGPIYTLKLVYPGQPPTQ